MFNKIVRYIKFRAFIDKVVNAELIIDALPEEVNKNPYEDAPMFHHLWQSGKSANPDFEMEISNIKKNLSFIAMNRKVFQAENPTKALDIIQKSVLNQSYSDSVLGDMKTWYAGSLKKINGLTVAMVIFLALVSFGLMHTNSQLGKLDLGIKEVWSSASGSATVIQEEFDFKILSKHDSKSSPASLFSMFDFSFSPKYMKVYRIEGKQERMLQLGRIADQKSEDLAPQFLSISSRSSTEGYSAEILTDGKTIEIEIKEGNYYYFGHKGHTIIFKRADYEIRLKGTKVYIEAGQFGDEVNVSVLEGNVEVSSGQQGQKTSIAAGEHIQLRSIDSEKKLNIYESSTVKPLNPDDLKKLYEVHNRNINHMSIALAKIKVSEAAILKSLTGVFPDHAGQIENLSNNAPATKSNNVGLPKGISAIFSRLLAFQKSQLKVRIATKNGNIINGTVKDLSEEETNILTTFGEYRSKLSDIKEIYKSP